MIAIETHYIGPTNFKGSRVKAQVCEAASNSFGKRRTLTLSWADELNSDENHKRAIVALIQKLNWTPEHGYKDWYVGGTERGMVAICAIDKLEVTA